MSRIQAGGNGNLLEQGTFIGMEFSLTDLGFHTDIITDLNKYLQFFLVLIP